MSWPTILVAVLAQGAPVDEHGFAEVATRYSVAGATQLLKFVAGQEAVYGSFRRRPEGPVLAAWRSDGVPLWEASHPEATHLVRTRDHLALAYDPGVRDAERGLVWIAPATGREERRIRLPGAPLRMSYLERLDLLVVFLMSEGRLKALSGPDVWLGVLAFGATGKTGWIWKEPCHEMLPLHVADDGIVVATSKGTERAVIGLNASDGRERWRIPWPYTGDLPGGVEAKEGGTVLPCEKGVRYLDGKGGEKGALPLALGGRWQAWGDVRDGRLYATCDDLAGVTLASYDPASGRMLWSQKSGTVSYAGPVAWGTETVVLANRSDGGLVGATALTELRIHADDGKVLGRFAGPRPTPSDWGWVTSERPQAVYGRLYAAYHLEVLALRRR